MFTYERKIRFFEADPAGIMFYGEIFKICHEVYEEFISSLNLSFDLFNSNDLAVPILSASAEYFKPIKAGELIKITISDAQLKNSSFELSYEISGGDDSKKISAKTVHVFIDNTGKKILIPAEFKENVKKIF